MCEQNEVGRLNSLGFVGMQKDVEALLSYKARNSDPLRFPNYYKVLYSWHISRGDYRSGESDISLLYRPACRRDPSRCCPGCSTSGRVSPDQRMWLSVLCESG